MAQQDTRTEAVAQPSEDRTHFIRHTDADGSTSHSAPLGFYRVEHRVCVFEREHDDHDVTIALTCGAASIHESLSPDEARTLASALTLAANHADAIKLQKTYAKWAASPADEVAA